MEAETTEEQQVLPCPFCGNIPEAYGPTEREMGMKLARVECECGVGTSNFETQAEAIEFWNERQHGHGSSSPEAGSYVERLQQAQSTLGNVAHEAQGENQTVWKMVVTAMNWTEDAIQELKRST